MNLLEEIHADVKAHGETLARIDERTMQHEKRMDRTDRRSAAISSGGGLLGGALAILVKSLFPGSGS